MYIFFFRKGEWRCQIQWCEWSIAHGTAEERQRLFWSGGCCFTRCIVSVTKCRLPVLLRCSECQRWSRGWPPQMSWQPTEWADLSGGQALGNTLQGEIFNLLFLFFFLTTKLYLYLCLPWKVSTGQHASHQRHLVLNCNCHLMIHLHTGHVGSFCLTVCEAAAFCDRTRQNKKSKSFCFTCAAIRF